MPIKQKIKKLFQRKIKHLKLNKRICPVCGSVKRTKILNIDNWKKIDSKGNIYLIDKRYCLCRSCDLVYTNPTVNPKVFDKLYENSIVGSFTNQKNKKNKKKTFTFDKISKKFLKKNINILEVGCGSGILLKHLHQKYRFSKKYLNGLEPSKEIFKTLKSNKFFKVQNIFLNDLSDKKKYDFIIMDNVFEHFEYPRKSLIKISKILSSDGLIYISIPNSEKIKNLNNDPFNHTCKYNLDNIKILLNNYNFKIMKFNKDLSQINLIAKKNSNKLLKFKNNKIFIKNLKIKISKIKIDIENLKNKIKKIRKLIIPQNKKLVIFGAGNYSLWILDLLKLNKYIKYGVDNNSIYQNKTRNNIRILSPNKLLDQDYNYILVLSAAFKKDITKQILKMKIEKSKILTF